MLKIKALLAFLVFSAFCLTGFNSAKAVEAPNVTANSNKSHTQQVKAEFLTIKFKTTAHVKIPKDPEIEVTISEGALDGKRTAKLCRRL